MIGKSCMVIGFTASRPGPCSPNTTAVTIDG
jgi:hypothetical protein